MTCAALCAWLDAHFDDKAAFLQALALKRATIVIART